MIEIINSADDVARQKWDVLVPTMGALHAGHQSLIKLAKSYGEKVIVSIFINPLQFENNQDLENYPKTLQADLLAAETAGAAAVFAPTLSTMYPNEIEKIPAGALGNLYEGAARSDHFSGVLTAVKRLFDLVKPNAAVFGEKDFQQLFLIRQMVERLNIPIKIINAATVRDTNGLALSSRNIHLNSQDEKVAQVLYRAITKADTEEMLQVIASENKFKLDYLEVIDETSFEKATLHTQNKRVIIAGWVNSLRLIDNMAMELSQ